MQVGLVIGTATATKKHASLRAQKLLVVQPRMADRRSADGDPLVVVDCVGAGTGEHVMITSDSSSVREFVGDETTPARWTTVGICDN